MKRTLFCLPFFLLTSLHAAHPWPQFRGPGGDGIAAAEEVPTVFGETEALKWKTAIPGRGWSSPVFDGEFLWLTSAVEVFPSEEERTRLLKASGEEERTFPELQVATRIELSAFAIEYETGRIAKTIPLTTIDQPQTVHTLNSFASPTPVLDGGTLFAHFGTFGTFAIDLATGRILWQRRIDLVHGVGPGSSPFVHGGLLFLICDGIDRQFVTALDLRTGETAWITERPAMRAPKGHQKKSFNTPVLVTGPDGKEQLLCMGAQWLVSYEPTTGKEIWRLDHGDGFSVVPRPVYSADTGLLYLSTGYGKPSLLAVRIDGKGEVSASDKVAWREPKRIPSRPSPLLVGDELYLIADGGIASCLDARTGKMHWTERIDGNYSASPLFADGKIYFASQEGLVTVVKPGRTFAVLARNTLEDTLMASPIALDRSLILRTGSSLYRFGP